MMMKAVQVLTLLSLSLETSLSLTPKVPNLAGFAAITQGHHLEDTKVTKILHTDGLNTKLPICWVDG